MGFTKYIINQVRYPRGTFGRRVAKRMNKGHASLAEWGLSNIKLRADMKILDIGCGGGANVNSFAKIVTNEKVFGID